MMQHSLSIISGRSNSEELRALESEAGRRAGRSQQLSEIDRQPETVRLTCLVNIFGCDIGARVFRRVVPASAFGLTGKPAPVVPMLNHNRR